MSPKKKKQSGVNGGANRSQPAPEDRMSTGPNATSSSRPRRQSYKRETLRNKSSWITAVEFMKAICVLMLAACSTSVSQLAMSPVYGSIPTSLYHRSLLISTIFLSWMSGGSVQRRFEKNADFFWLGNQLAQLLPFLAFSISIIQSFLFRLSAYFGPIFGPMITELGTSCALLYLSVVPAMRVVDMIGQSFAS